jgi:hypothetical protein
MLVVLFINKQGKPRVDMGQFLIVNTKGGKLLGKSFWSDSVRENDNLSMPMVLAHL